MSNNTAHDTAQLRIKALLAEATAKLVEATQVADETGAVFYWEGPDYGMGGSYVPETADDEAWSSSSTGWLASSNSC